MAVYSIKQTSDIFWKKNGIQNLDNNSHTLVTFKICGKLCQSHIKSNLELTGYHSRGRHQMKLLSAKNRKLRLEFTLSTLKVQTLD